jgi:ornithine cyclodeaminase
MLNVSAADIKDSLQWGTLTDAVREMFRRGCEMPARHHHKVKVAGEPDATLLLMPAWTPGGYLGTKILNVFPGNSERDLPSISANYLLSSAKTGEMLALIDGGELTAARTAAASALAASYLARTDASHLLIVGTGRLAPLLASAHASQRPVNTITVWGRTPDKAEALARDLTVQGMNAQATDDLKTAVGNADIVSCATMAEESLIHGEWLQPGTHVDLVGAYTGERRCSWTHATERPRKPATSPFRWPPVSCRWTASPPTSTTFAAGTIPAAPTTTKSPCSNRLASRWRIWRRRFCSMKARITASTT